MICVCCKTDLEMINVDTLQPRDGGQIELIFSYGSKFDEYVGITEYTGVICDGCAESFLLDMKKVGYDMNGDEIESEFNV